jgi:hypothetical protein
VEFASFEASFRKSLRVFLTALMRKNRTIFGPKGEDLRGDCLDECIGPLTPLDCSGARGRLAFRANLIFWPTGQSTSPGASVPVCRIPAWFGLDPLSFTGPNGTTLGSTGGSLHGHSVD